MIGRALFAMGFGMLGALALQGAVWLIMPPPPRLAQVDLVAIMQDEVRDLAGAHGAGKQIDTSGRAAVIQEALRTVSAETGHVLIARQAVLADPGMIPDFTDRIRAWIRERKK